MGPALYKGGKDKRLTKVGKFLREHHLDELPQLWNVFCGQMAFIGPRPERKYFIDQIMEHDARYVFCIRYDRVLLRMLRYIMGTQIRWIKCCVVFAMICFICSIAHGGLILRSW